MSTGMTSPRFMKRTVSETRFHTQPPSSSTCFEGTNTIASLCNTNHGEKHRNIRKTENDKGGYANDNSIQTKFLKHNDDITIGSTKTQSKTVSLQYHQYQKQLRTDAGEGLRDSLGIVGVSSSTTITKPTALLDPTTVFGQTGVFGTATALFSSSGMLTTMPINGSIQQAKENLPTTLLKNNPSSSSFKKQQQQSQNHSPSAREFPQKNLNKNFFYLSAKNAQFRSEKEQWITSLDTCLQAGMLDYQKMFTDFFLEKRLNHQQHTTTLTYTKQKKNNMKQPSEHTKAITTTTLTTTNNSSHVRTCSSPLQKETTLVSPPHHSRNLLIKNKLHLETLTTIRTECGDNEQTNYHKSKQIPVQSRFDGGFVPPANIRGGGEQIQRDAVSDARKGSAVDYMNYLQLEEGNKASNNNNMETFRCVSPLIFDENDSSKHKQQLKLQNRQNRVTVHLPTFTRQTTNTKVSSLWEDDAITNGRTTMQATFYPKSIIDREVVAGNHYSPRSFGGRGGALSSITGAGGGAIPAGSALLLGRELTVTERQVDVRLTNPIRGKFSFANLRQEAPSGRGQRAAVKNRDDFVFRQSQVEAMSPNNLK